MTAIVAGALGIVTALASAGAAPADAMPRVRSSHPYIAAMIAEAQVRSATFRGLVAAIDATDGIVYVEEGECRHGVKSCLPTVVTPAGGMRLLRVIVDARLPDWDVMAAIGHELQHALEILRDPHVRTTEAAYFLFSRERGSTGDSFETAAARTAGDAVRRDVAAFARDGSTRRGPPRH